MNADHVLVAIGAKPRPLEMAGVEHVTTSAEFLELDELPERVAFVGGGYISFEFAQVAARAGAEATILHRSERVLKAFDPELVDRLVTATRDAGFTVRTNAPVSAVEQASEQLLGERVEETVNLFALAIREEIPTGERRQVPWAYPTHGPDPPYMV